MIDKKWKWVAKDSSSAIYVFTAKPVLLDYHEEWKPGGECESCSRVLVINGNWKDSLHEIIHHEDGKIEFRKARPELKVDDPVLVRSNVAHGWVGRHFAGWDGDGHILVWDFGCTSFSATTNHAKASPWPEYKLP